MDKSPVGSFLEEGTFSVRVHSLSQEYERRDISCCVSLSSQIRCHKSKACIIKRGVIGGAPSWMIVWLNFDSGIIFENSQCWKNLHYKCRFFQHCSDLLLRSVLFLFTFFVSLVSGAGVSFIFLCFFNLCISCMTLDTARKKW